jgi:two-component system, cell cycle sensor histidine kinase and response regulator CckA
MLDFRDPYEMFTFISALTGQMFYEYDIEGKNLNWYGAIEQVTGYNANLFQQKVDRTRWIQLMHPDDREPAGEAYKAAAVGIGRYNLTYRLRKKDQSYLFVEDTGSFFYDASTKKPIKAVGAIKDITEFRKTQRALFRAERLRSVAELASGVSHNFNNVLQAIMGCARLCLLGIEKNDTADLVNLLKTILESANTGARTVSKLQSFSALREETTLPCEETIDVSQVVEKCIEISQPRWKTEPERKGIFIQVFKNLQPSLLVKMRESDLVEVVINLINNAVDAMPLGGSLSFKTHRNKDFDKVAIEIIDTGTGIADINKSYIFEPFWTTKGNKGTGLGLASSIGIVSSYNGEVNVESAEGKGSMFRIQLPPAEKTEKLSEYMDTVILDRPIKILIIDDQEVIAKLYAKGFEILGHETFFATSGIEGLPLFYNNQPDVIICDLAMPEMNGWQIGKVILEYVKLYDIRKPFFILLTGWAVDDELEEIEKSGVDRVIQKPVELKVLVAEIDHYLKER